MSSWIRLLEAGVAPKAAWVQRLGDDFPVVERFLVPTGRFADFLPCGKNPVKGCGWRVVPGDTDVLTAICPENSCDPIVVSRADRAMLRVDTGLIASALAKALGLSGAPSIDSGGAHLGWISPVQSARYAAFLSLAPGGESHFPLVQRIAERAAGPFAVVLPSRENIDMDLAAFLVARDALPVFLDEELDFLPDGTIEAEDARMRLSEFALVRAGIKHEFKLPRFPTPNGANWPDITITAENEHTLRFAAVVRTGMNVVEVVQAYTFEDLGLMKSARDLPVPTTDWESFLLKIVRERRVVGDSIKHWGSLRTSKKRISRILGDLTGLDPKGAFTDYPGLRCYEAMFKVECERGMERHLPIPPRRLNQLGHVARNANDE